MTDGWADLPLAQRIRRVCPLRHQLADNPQPFIDAIALPFRRSEVETLAAEIIPLADACKFLERNAAKILRPKPLALRGRPLWLWGITAQIHRVPLGRILIIAPQNYPLMLAGIQTIQALVAGNTVFLKPAPSTRPLATLFAETLYSIGLPKTGLIVLDESPEAAKNLFSEVDKVIMTGSHASGRNVAADLAQHLKPSTMELSGCDAAIILPGADIPLAAASIRFGLTFNGSNSCIAPRRLLVHASLADTLIAELSRQLKDAPPLTISQSLRDRITDLAAGATPIIGTMPISQTMTPLIFDHATPCMRLQTEDIGAPIASILRVNSTADILAANESCPFALGASIFGPTDDAHKLAMQLNVGSVIINDLMAPTADPRLPFGGTRASGFGVTRGAEGLLEMTRPKTIQISRRSPRFHLQAENKFTGDLVRGQLQMTHGKGFSRRWAGMKKMVSSARRQRAEKIS